MTISVGAMLIAGCGQTPSARRAGLAAIRAPGGLKRRLVEKTPGGQGYVLQCGNPRVTGGLPRDYQSSSLTAGPIAIYPARSEYPQLSRDDFPLSNRHARPLRFPPLEAAVTVAAHHTVIAALVTTGRPHAAFLFDRALFTDAERGYTLAEGEQRVTFVGCDTPYTQYQGGFVVDRAQCARLDIFIDRARRPIRRTLEFGRRQC